MRYCVDSTLHTWKAFRDLLWQLVAANQSFNCSHVKHSHDACSICIGVSISMHNLRHTIDYTTNTTIINNNCIIQLLMMFSRHNIAITNTVISWWFAVFCSECFVVSCCGIVARSPFSAQFTELQLWTFHLISFLITPSSQLSLMKNRSTDEKFNSYRVWPVATACAPFLLSFYTDIHMVEYQPLFYSTQNV